MTNTCTVLVYLNKCCCDSAPWGLAGVGKAREGQEMGRWCGTLKWGNARCLQTFHRGQPGSPGLLSRGKKVSKKQSEDSHLPFQLPCGPKDKVQLETKGCRGKPRKASRDWKECEGHVHRIGRNMSVPQPGRAWVAILAPPLLVSLMLSASSRNLASFLVKCEWQASEEGYAGRWDHVCKAVSAVAGAGQGHSR